VVFKSLLIFRELIEYCPRKVVFLTEQLNNLHPEEDLNLTSALLVTELYYSFQQHINCNTASTPDLEFSSHFTLTITTSTKCTVRQF